MSPSHHHHDNHHLHRHHYHHNLSHDLHHIHFQLDDKYYPGAAQKVVREQIRCCNRGQSPWFVFFHQLWWFRKKRMFDILKSVILIVIMMLIVTRPSIPSVTQLRAFMPVYIEKSGDLVGCYRCLTDRQQKIVLLSLYKV